MQHEAEDAEALRRRLYRPDASAADLATYLHATAVDDDLPGAPTESDGRPDHRPRWAVAVGVLGVLGAVIVSGALIRGTVAAARPTPTSAVLTLSTPVPGSGSGGITVVTAVLDSGRERHATGDAVAEGPDRYRYTVSPGDTVARVADRFGLCAADVLIALPYGFDSGALPADQTIVLQRTSTVPPSYDSTGAC